MSIRAVIHVESGIVPTCSHCGCSSGLWNSENEPLRHCGNCGALLDWGTVEDGDDDDSQRPPRDGELEPFDIVAASAPREEYQAVGIALANELRRLSVRAFGFACAVSQLEADDPIGVDLGRMARSLAQELAGWGGMTLPPHPKVSPIAQKAEAYIAAHPGAWLLDLNGRLCDQCGQPFEIPPEDVNGIICVLHDTERYSHEKLDAARLEIRRLKRRAAQ